MTGRDDLHTSTVEGAEAHARAHAEDPDPTTQELDDVPLPKGLGGIDWDYVRAHGWDAYPLKDQT